MAIHSTLKNHAARIKEAQKEREALENALAQFKAKKELEIKNTSINEILYAFQKIGIIEIIDGVIFKRQ